MIYKILNRKLQIEPHEFHKEKTEKKSVVDVISSWSTSGKWCATVCYKPGDRSWIRKWRDYGYTNGTYALSFVTQIFHNDWLVIAYRPERSISVILRTRTRSILNENYKEMREGWVNRVNGCRLPLRNNGEMNERFSLL